MMFATHGRTDDEILAQFLQDLPARLVPLHLIYERTENDALHCWVISGGFEDLDAEARGSLVWPVFRSLHAGVMLRISLIFKMTPAEFEEEYEVRLDDLPEGLEHLERLA